jgi:hypothetical protein
MLDEVLIANELVDDGTISKARDNMAPFQRPSNIFVVANIFFQRYFLLMDL